MNRITSLLAALALATSGTVAQANAALVFSPPASATLVGAPVVVEVRGQGFSNAVVGGGFDLTFNPSIVSLDSVEIAVAEWELFSNPGTIDNAAGTLTAVWFNAFAAPLPTGNFPVATLRFTALAPGVAGLQLLGNASFPFVSDTVEVINVSYGGGAITVSVVPEPASAASLLLGLALLPWLRRRLAAA